MKYALIGCGRIATNHVKAVLNNHLEFVAACDLEPQNIQTLLAKHGLENDPSIARYTDYKQMIADHPELELVAIATSSGLSSNVKGDAYFSDGTNEEITIKKMTDADGDTDEVTVTVNIRLLDPGSDGVHSRPTLVLKVTVWVSLTTMVSLLPPETPVYFHLA